MESKSFDATLESAMEREAHFWIYTAMCCVMVLSAWSGRLGSDKLQVVEPLWCFARQATKLSVFVGRLLVYVALLCPCFVGMFYYWGIYAKDIISVRYSSASARHTNDVYLTKAAVEAKARGEQPAPTAPVLFVVPGGAWVIGHKSYVAMMCRVLRSAGFLCVAADYRYWPQVSLDGMAEDVDLALGWTFQNIAQYGGDPKRVTIVSLSSGAHIASLLLARRARRTLNGEGPATSWTCSDVFGFVGLGGVYHFSGGFVDGLYNKGFFRCILDAAGKTQDARDDRSATVLFAREPELVAELPPMLLVHCVADKISPLQQSVAFHSTIEAGGGRAHLTVRPGGGHNDPVIHDPLMSEHSIVREIILSVHRWGTEGFANGTDAEPCTPPGRSSQQWKVTAEKACEEELSSIPTWPRVPSSVINLGRFITPF